MMKTSPLFVQFANILGRFQWLTCPRKVTVLLECSHPIPKRYICTVISGAHSVEQMQDLSTGWLHCDPGPIFKPEYYSLPGLFSHWVSQKSSKLAVG